MDTFECIKDTDKNFLPLLGRGTVASSLAEWRQQVTTHSGLLVRRVKDDPIHGYTIGEERISTKSDATKSKSYSGSGSVTASGAAGGVPVSGSLNASASRSSVENLSSADLAIVTRTYAFKEETPTFPTELEKDLYKWMAECLGQMRRQSFVNVPAKDLVEKVEKYVEKLEPRECEAECTNPAHTCNEWQVIEQIIKAYIERKEVTDYVFSIALGVKEAESSHSTTQRTEKSGGGSIGATGFASVGFSGKGEKKDDKNQHEKKGIGRVKVSEETGDVSVEDVGVVKVGVIGISNLIKSVVTRRIVQRKAEEYRAFLSKEENCFAPLVGPIVISCMCGTNPEHREVFWEVNKDGVVGGTTDGGEASHFYLEDKGEGQLCIHFYGKAADIQYEDCNWRRLYVKRSNLPNTGIQAAVSKWEYDEAEDLLFEITTRFCLSYPWSVTDWQRKRDMVYLSVSKNLFLWWGKKAFYIQMNVNDTVTPPKFTLSLVSEGAISPHNSTQQLFFCSKPSPAAPTGGTPVSRSEPPDQTLPPVPLGSHNEPPTQDQTLPPVSPGSDKKPPPQVHHSEPRIYSQPKSRKGQLLGAEDDDSEEDPEPD